MVLFTKTKENNKHNQYVLYKTLFNIKRPSFCLNSIKEHFYRSNDF